MAANQGFFGNSAGPGSRFRAYIEFRISEYGENSAYVQYKYSISVDSGDFYGTVCAKSWGGSATLYGSGWYGDSGWQNHGWVSYGSGVSKSCSAQYTSYSGAFHKSSCSATYRPSAPTWQPKAVTNAKSTRNSNTQNTVTWTRNTTAARPYAGIYVDRQIDGGEWALLADVAGNATSYVDRSARPNHAYRYRICPYNSAGNASHAYTETTKNPPTSPPAPTGASNTRNSDASNTVRWTNNATGEAPYNSVPVERSTDGGGWSAVATVGGSATSYTDSNTSANHYYRYRVRSYNASGYSGYAATGYTYNTPAAPGTPSGARTGDTTVELSIPNGANTATATELQRSTDAQSWSTIATTSGKATSYTDNPGGGTFYYRARNTRASLASAWSASSDAVVTICAPAAPSLASPTSGAVIPTEQKSIEFKWGHNPIDGSRQTAAQLQYSTDGKTWTTVDVQSAQSATVANAFPLNSTVYWRVRTKGAHASYGPWSGNRVLYARQAPQVAFLAPGKIENVPVDIELQYFDASGTLSAMAISVIDRSTGSEVFSRSIVTTACSIGRDQWMPQDGGRYRLAATARSTSGLQSVATRDVEVAFDLPKRASLKVTADAERGYAAIECIVDMNGEGQEVESISVWRVNGEDAVLLASDLVDGSTVEDKYAPLNTEYAYRAASYASSGAMRTADHTGSIKTPYAFLYFGDGEIARGMWNPEESISVKRASRTMVRYAGRTYPVLYDGGGIEETRSFAAHIKDEEEAHMFERLMAFGRCVYKSVGGAVMHAAVDVDLSPDHVLPNRYGEVAVTLTRVDGGAL